MAGAIRQTQSGTGLHRQFPNQKASTTCPRVDFHTTRRSRDSPGTRKLPDSQGGLSPPIRLSFTGYLTDVSQPDGTHVADRIEVITGFSLHGKPSRRKGLAATMGYISKPSIKASVARHPISSTSRLLKWS